ncbi:MAG: alpha/beta hydrolase [Micrococcales bacterium]|nr:alpha/beta hydrolase [Micrococcales bacterium]
MGTDTDTTADVLGDTWTTRTLRLRDDPLTRRTGVRPVATLVSQRVVDPARVAVLHVHGFVDYFFHDHLAAPLAGAGYQLYGLDLRDCGRSSQPGRPINDTDSLARYTEEIDRSVRELALTHGKVVVVAHSTGGLTAALWADARPYLVERGTLAALVLSSPWLDLPGARWAKTVRGLGADLLGRVAPRKVVTHLPEHYGKALHRSSGGEWDYDLAWKSHESPPVTAGFVRSVRQAQTRVAHGLDIGCPVLVLASTASSPGDHAHDRLITTDCVLDVADMERLVPRLGADVTFRQIDGGAHDLSLSPSPAREAFVEAMVTFLDARVPA